MLFRSHDCAGQVFGGVGAGGPLEVKLEAHPARYVRCHLPNSSYLHLDEVLGAQHPLSPGHDEMLFIVQHQTSELWMKLMLHELRGAISHLASDDLAPAFKMLSRVSRIMEQLVHAWDVLATMTPAEYSAIRPYLAQSSGFQSWQYRCIEFALGNKNAALLQPHAHRPEIGRAHV